MESIRKSTNTREESVIVASYILNRDVEDIRKIHIRFRELAHYIVYSALVNFRWYTDKKTICTGKCFFAQCDFIFVVNDSDFSIAFVF